MSEETELVLNHLDQMYSFYQWSVGIFITLIVMIIGLLSFFQWRINTKDKEFLKESMTEKLKENEIHLTKTLNFKFKYSEFETTYNYVRSLIIGIDKGTLIKKKFRTVGGLIRKCFGDIENLIDFLQQKEYRDLKEEYLDLLDKKFFNLMNLYVLSIKKAITENEYFEENEKICFEVLYLINKIYYSDLFQNKESNEEKLKQMIDLNKEYIIKNKDSLENE